MYILYCVVSIPFGSMSVVLLTCNCCEYTIIIVPFHVTCQFEVIDTLLPSFLPINGSYPWNVCPLSFLYWLYIVGTDSTNWISSFQNQGRWSPLLMEQTQHHRA